MGRYQQFILDLLKEVMTPGVWMSIEEISSNLISLKSKSKKSYVQLPTKHSLAQQMCRFYKDDIKVEKQGNRNAYLMKITDEDEVDFVRELRTKYDLKEDSWPEDWWTMRELEKYGFAFRDWQMFNVEIEDTEEEFELWR